MKPSPSGDNGRDKAGRFASGNRFSLGNPHAQRIAKLRAALIEAVTPADVRAVVKALVRKAKRGDVIAIRELLDRTIGKAVPALDGDGPATPAVELVRALRALVTGRVDDDDA